MMRDDELSLLEELVGDADAFAQQSTRIATQIELQALQVAEGIKRLGYFVLGRFIKTVDVHVSDAGLDQEVNVNRVTRNFVADQGELHRLLDAFARNADV